MKKLLTFILCLYCLFSTAQQTGVNGNWVIKGSLTVSGTTKSGIKTVTTSKTVTKSDSVILASGDITISLPSITSADNGLKINIKNDGTYTDLVTVQGTGGQLIDGVTTSKLTRWQAKIYLAYNSAWYVTDKNTRADNIYDVAATGSFTTIPEVIAFLNEHISAPSVIRLGGGTYTLAATQICNWAYDVTFEGISFGETIITAASGLANKPMFRCLTNVYFKMIQFNTSGLANYGDNTNEDCIHYLNNGGYSEVKDCTISGFNIGILDSTRHELWIFENDFNYNKVAGLKVFSAIDSVKIRIQATDFIKNVKGLWLEKGGKAWIAIDGGCNFLGRVATDTMIIYRPSLFSGFQAIYMTGITWNNTGKFIEGFDFTRADGRDANAFVQNNAGMEDKNPHCKINLVNNLTTTTITTAGTYYKVNFTNTSSYTCKWTIANNRITYQPVNKRDVVIYLSGNVQVNNNNRDVDFVIIKNGQTATRYGNMTVRATTANQPYPWSSNIYLSDVAATDYFEIYATSTSNGDVIILQDLTWYTQSR